jgi:hypothetical protein
MFFNRLIIFGIKYNMKKGGRVLSKEELLLKGFLLKKVD